MTLITLHHVHLGYGSPLLEDVSFSLERGERIALIGRNGTGKSTLLKLLDRQILPDDGDLFFRDGIRVARLDQEVPIALAGTVYQVVAGGLGALGELLSRIDLLSREPTDNPESLKALQQCQEAMDEAGAWEQPQAIDALLDRLELPRNSDIQSLSGGLKRRVLLARALATQPDVLLLDEPTNHLDLDAILWLENFLLGWKGALILITHDRAFLQKVATRILELDRGLLSDFPGDYPTYLRRKAEALNAEAKNQAEFDKRLAQEEAWIRQGIKARRTRDMGRVRRLLDMRQQRLERRTLKGQANIQIQQAERSGKLVVEAEAVEFCYGDRPILREFSTTILRGDRVGIIGPNGSGKTTLLRLLLGDLKPSSGMLRQGTNLEVAYFDQYRATLDENASVIDNVAQGSDRVTLNGRNIHAIGYLQDFLFTPDRARQPVRSLSGGERNRLLLARLFTQPANVLVLDEPTNDLDAETLELLEERLTDFEGTVLVVSHDRAFLNNLVTSVLVFEEAAVVREYVGGYEDWVRQRPAKTPAEATRPRSDVARDLTESAPTPRPRKLSFKESKELEALPGRIESLEDELSRLTAAMNDPSFYQQSRTDIQAHEERLNACQKALETAYQNWESLEARATAT